MISKFLVEFSLFFKIPSSIDLLLTQTLISSFFRPPNFAIFNKDLKGSWDLVQSFYFLYKTFKKLKYLSLPEHLAITDAFKANLSRGKS